ncbi:hypothetical protein K0M31_018833, partial [Melipona bicolor]
EMGIFQRKKNRLTKTAGDRHVSVLTKATLVPRRSALLARPGNTGNVTIFVETCDAVAWNSNCGGSGNSHEVASDRRDASFHERQSLQPWLLSPGVASTGTSDSANYNSVTSGPS